MTLTASSSVVLKHLSRCLLRIHTPLSAPKCLREFVNACLAVIISNPLCIIMCVCISCRLEEGGQTALGPALLLAVSMASRIPGSKVMMTLL